MASKEERFLIEKRHGKGRWGLGALLIIGAYIPFFFILLPVICAQAYSFFALNALQALRSRPVL